MNGVSQDMKYQAHNESHGYINFFSLTFFALEDTSGMWVVALCLCVFWLPPVAIMNGEKYESRDFYSIYRGVNKHSFLIYCKWLTD